MIKKSLFCFFTYMFFLLSTLYAEEVNKIIIIGNTRVSDETVKIYGNIQVNKNYDESDINRIVRDIYSTNFFENVQIEIVSGTLTVNLVEHPIINQLIIVGEKSNKYKDTIRNLIQSKEKGSFIKSIIASDIEKIKSLYSSAGFNFSKVDFKIKKLSDANYDVLIDINRGEKTKISSISFIGNKKIRDRRLRDVIASEENKFWKFLSRNTNYSEQIVNLDLRLLRNYYKSLGYYDVKIDFNSAELNPKKNIDLQYSIDAGKRYTLNKISTKTDPVFDKKLFYPLNDIFKDYIGEYYSPFKVKKMLEELDEIIDANNLQFVEHNVQETISDNSINLTFNIMEGEKILIERINIKGNSITKESVIRGELLVDEGDPFTTLGIDKSIAEIKSRNIFNDVKYEVLEGSKNDLKIININVEEKPTGEISAGAGIGTNGGTIAFNVRENNWLGEGKSVDFDVELDQESLSGQLSYNDPNYDFLGNSLTYSLSSETNDKPDQGYENTIIGSGIRTSFEQYKDVRASLGLSLSYDDLRTQNNASAELKKQSGSFTDLSGQYGFSYDKRDRSFRPTSGSIYQFNQSLPIYADKPSISNNFSSSSYYSINENIISSARFLISSINSIGSESDDVRLSQRLGLPSKRLRGFERNKVGPVDNKDHIGGNYASSLNFDINLPNFLPESTRTDVGLFLDFGNVWGVDYDSSIDDSNKIRSSTGVNASWISPIGPMTFTFSQNLSKASTDSTESFNFNLGTTF